HLPSFPTRRSSDLRPASRAERPRRAAARGPRHRCGDAVSAARSFDRRALPVARLEELRRARSAPLAGARLPAQAPRRHRKGLRLLHVMDDQDPPSTLLLSEAARELDWENDPLWYKDAIIYQIHVRAFFDSNDDGIGDFKGLTGKLDYIQRLGVNALWLLPFYPSPMRDDGYDIADYRNINPVYGTLRDFKRFVREAHRRGLKVITELVVNHTSDQHPW